MPTIESFAKIVPLGQRPENQHLVAWNDEQRAACEAEAARRAAAFEASKPTPPEPPPAVAKLRKEFEALTQAELDAKSAALQKQEEIDQHNHQIWLAEQAVKSLEIEVGAIAAVDFKKKATEIKTTLLTSIPTWETSDPTRMVQHYAALLYLYETLAPNAAAKLKEKQQALNTARKHLASLTESK